MRSILFVLMGFFASSQALAQPFFGGNGSGGGMGVVCRNSDGSIRSVELLDLWEARVIYSRPPILSSASVKEQVHQSLENFKNSVYAGDLTGWEWIDRDTRNPVRGPEALHFMLRDEAEKFLLPGISQVHRLRGVTLKRTDDAFEVVTPRDCEIEQLVRYKDTLHGGEILINQDLVDHMDKTNIAALYVHEIIYAYLRRSIEKSSLRVRRAVGMAFAGHRFRSLESFLPNQYYECTDKVPAMNRVVVYVPETDNCVGYGAVLQVVEVAGLKMLDFESAKTCAGGSAEDLFNGPTPLGGWLPLGSRVGFDYVVDVEVGGTNGAKQATLQLASAPDQTPSQKVTLTCRLQTKN